MVKVCARGVQPDEKGVQEVCNPLKKVCKRCATR